MNHEEFFGSLKVKIEEYLEKWGCPSVGLGVIYQDEILTGGGTDTSEMQMARDGAMATCISIPTRNIHLPVEIFNIDDVQGAAKLLAAAMCAKL